MKVKFANAEVDVWKLRKGVVVEYSGLFYHIESIGSVDKLAIGTVASIYLDSTRSDMWVYSDELTWLEPH